MTAPVIQALIFDPPLVSPAAPGLYSATLWTEASGPSRFLSDGVKIRPWNYGGSDAFGVWGDEPWCAVPDSGSESLKTGVRPDMDPDPFAPITVWAYDECDLTAASQAEVNARVQQILRLEEQTAVETAVGGQLILDAPAPVARTSLATAVAYLEGELAKTNTVGVIHASAAWASVDPDQIRNVSGAMRTTLGHRWVFGGGYVDTLGDVLVATSPLFGWRDAVQVRSTMTEQENTYAAIAERSVVVGYESLIAAVQIT